MNRGDILKVKTEIKYWSSKCNTDNPISIVSIGDFIIVDEYLSQWDSFSGITGKGTFGFCTRDYYETVGSIYDFIEVIGSTALKKAFVAELKDLNLLFADEGIHCELIKDFLIRNNPLRIDDGDNLTLQYEQRYTSIYLICSNPQLKISIPDNWKFLIALIECRILYSAKFKIEDQVQFKKIEKVRVSFKDKCYYDTSNYKGKVVTITEKKIFDGRIVYGFGGIFYKEDAFDFASVEDEQNNDLEAGGQ